MTLRLNTPCDIDCFCPYGAQYSNDCEWYCGAEEPEDNYKTWEEDD